MRYLLSLPLLATYKLLVTLAALEYKLPRMDMAYMRSLLDQTMQ